MLSSFSILDDNMTTEIFKELATTKKTNEMTSEQVLFWTRRIKTQRD